MTREEVFDVVRRIPRGKERTYGLVAAAAGYPRAARAVGRLLHTNDTPVVVPCHRVVGADGTLTGFAGGLDVKRRLLELEGVDVGRLCDLLAGRAALGGVPALNRQKTPFGVGQTSI